MPPKPYIIKHSFDDYRKSDVIFVLCREIMSKESRVIRDGK
jgi:hypothetical protein